MPTTSSSIVVVTQTQPSTVMFTLPEIQLEPVREAMARGPVEVTAFDQNNVKALGTGKLMLIDALIDQTTATSVSRPVSQHRRAAVARRIRQCAGAARHREQRPHDPLDRPAARPSGVFAWVVGRRRQSPDAAPIETGRSVRRGQRSWLLVLKTANVSSSKDITGCNQGTGGDQPPTSEQPRFGGSEGARSEHLRTVHPPASRDRRC